MLTKQHSRRQWTTVYTLWSVFITFIAYIAVLSVFDLSFENLLDISATVLRTFV